MSRNYDELNSMIAELIRKTKAEPSETDFQLLKTVSIRDIAQFFESVAQEKSDQARYEKLLNWLHNREEEKLSAVRRAEEEKQAKIRAEEEAKRKAEEEAAAKVRAAEEAKRRAEEEAAAAAKAAEEAKAAAAAEQARKEAEEKQRKEEERQEKLKTCAGQCENCGEWIDKKAKYLECDDMLLHPECLEPWQNKNCPKCAQCDKLCTEDFVNLSRGDVKVALHEECVAAWKENNK